MAQARLPKRSLNRFYETIDLREGKLSRHHRLFQASQFPAPLGDKEPQPPGMLHANEQDSNEDKISVVVASPAWEELSEDWKTRKSPATGEAYNANEKVGKSQFDPPANSSSKAWQLPAPLEDEEPHPRGALHADEQNPNEDKISVVVVLLSGEKLTTLTVDPSWSASDLFNASEAHVGAKKCLQGLLWGSDMVRGERTARQLGLSSGSVLQAIIGEAVEVPEPVPPPSRCCKR